MLKVCRILLYSVAAISSTLCGQVVSFVSDTSWGVFDADPSPGPATFLGFEQAVCLNALNPPTCPAGATLWGFGGSGWGANLSSIPGAMWVWAPGITGATAPAELAQFFFSKTFVLSAAPSAGTVSVSADDFAEVRVNGVVVGSVGSISDLSLSGLAQGSLTAFDITSLLVAGTNTITIRGRNGPGSFGGCTNCTYAQHPAGVVFGGSITVAGCGLHRVHGHISTVPSGHFDSIANHVHHGQHGHTVTMCSPPHHGPFHMTPETEEQSVLSASGPPDSLDFVVAVNQDGAIGVARHGTVLQLFRSARGLFIGDQHDRPSEVFTPPVSGVPLFQTTTLPQVRIGGTAAEVLFSGLAPGLTGVWQINVVVPEHVAGRKVPVTISYEGDDLKSIDVAVE